MGNRIRHASVMLAVTGGLAMTGTASMLSGPAVEARCIATNTTQETSAPGGTAVGKEWNINSGTCNNDFQYTGRFCDAAADGKRILMEFNWSGAGGGSAISDGVSCNWLWQFTDNDNVGIFHICTTNLSGAKLTCTANRSNVWY